MSPCAAAARPRSRGGHEESASQTAGPYVHIGLAPNAAGIPMFGGRDFGAAMIAGDPAGPRIVLTCRVLDGTGAPLRDAMLEIWQADAEGHIPPRDPGLAGWARRACDAETGLWRLETVRPGPVAGQAPHITVMIFARGINLALHTRIYFEGEEANAADPLLNRIDPPERRATLMAQPGADGGWHLDIRLQGVDETVFLDV
ncbi:protocatechuate 3,4-dioxygenase subunit alpha [Jannaschia ovalis]|uniref:Protocatechuate 3,4-dioxygenase subunit alpha n=1 Tax=Jannaschia ovalis TaxID=3038773 RepID=A0ABY8LI99_9RHOB|nr:protocatechuate 3,4-dioxygenase subunit alpha [Jannaschia sp. GRR-S6-38]WGH80387.1 protocatechuate 3,4-dioxygenase subunit alpha [Jannaschia sp. GRR-S6-38]